MNKKTIIFDFGGVLIDWNPRHLYKKIFENEEEMEWFLENVCTMEWNASLDKGVPFAKGVKQLQGLFPDYAEQIQHYHLRWPEMLAGEIVGTVEILKEIQSKNYRVYGLTNWSAETFPLTYERFHFLRTLDGIVVSGDERLIKPDREIFDVITDRYQLQPEACVFIDDNAHNIVAAGELGFTTVHFTSPEKLRKELMQMEVL